MMENIKELLDEWRQLSLEEQETKLNDYLLENKDKLYDEELIEILRYGIDLKDKVCEVTDQDEEEVNYAVTLNDCVFLRLWLARLYASDPNLETEGEALVEKSKKLMEQYDEDSFENADEFIDAHMKKIREIEDLINHNRQIRQSIYKQENGQDDDMIPASLAEYFDQLDMKTLYYRQFSNYVGHSKRRCYMFTGNRGTGKRTAAQLLYAKLKTIEDIDNYDEISAISLFDPSNGYSGIAEKIKGYRNDMIYIYDADELSLKGLLSQTGMEILANVLRTEPTVTVVLGGPKNELTQLVNSSQVAKELFALRFHFDDLSPETLTRKACEYVIENGFKITVEAKDLLYNYFGYEHKMRGNDFTNIHLTHKIIDDYILPHTITRVIKNHLVEGEATLITADDIPKIRHRDPKSAIERLSSLVGLDNIKESIMAHASLVNLNRRRMELGLFNHMPPMHMVFTGNPGTGKTTVAKLIGEIYHGMGVLSSGHLVETDRSKLVGQYLGDTEKNTLNAIKSAAGGVLFIDEAYNLFVEDSDRKDFGHRVIETLLTYLSMEQTNMIVVMAGYTAEMEHLLQSNPGLKSRFSYIFHFNDYTPEQLLKIGSFVLKEEHYELTPEAEKKLARYVINAYNEKDEHFGNGRFITRLLTTRIIPSLGNRLIKLPSDSITQKDLVNIIEADIPEIEDKKAPSTWDDTIINSALEQLDNLAGQDNVKRAIHEYVVSMRANHQHHVPTIGDDLTWSFIGNTGTGKSTVAEILAQILQGAGHIPTSHFTTLNVEEFANLPNPMSVVEKAMMRASDGLLFLDLDSPQYNNYNFDSLQFWIENKRRELKMSLAIVFAKTASDRDDVARNLVHNGLVPSNHILVFEDYKPDELLAIFKILLQRKYGLGITSEAEQTVSDYITRMHGSRKQTPTNARTMLLLAGTVAQIAQLRCVADASEQHAVSLADVSKLDWEGPLLYRRIGF